MKSTRFSRRKGGAAGAGFTGTDLLAVSAVVCVLGVLLVIFLTRAREKQRLELCLSNLQQVGRAVLLYAHEHGNTLPAGTSALPGDSWWWYKEQVKSYAGLSGLSSTNDRVFACPKDRGYSDPRPFSQSARFDYGSYVFNGVTLFGAPNIAGWKSDEIRQPGRTLLVMEWAAHAPLSWHRSRTGKANGPFYNDALNVVAFVDGHARLTPIYYDGYSAAYTRDPLPNYEYQYTGN